MLVYIAGPFFNDDQVKVIQRIEMLLKDKGINYFSPRSEGVLLDLNEVDRQAAKHDIYLKNVEMICECDHMIAVIDDRDIGTIWEMGYATALQIPVTTMSNKDYGLNVMLAESVKAHTLSVADAVCSVINESFAGVINREVF